MRERSVRPLSPAELEAWRGFLRAHSALVKQLDAEMSAAHGLPLTSYEVLLFLYDAPGGRMRMSELADSVLLSKSGLTRLCDRLVERGFVERQAAAADARGAYAVITGAGRDWFREARRTHVDGIRRLFTAHFNADELEQLARWWERVLPGAAREG